MILVFGSAGQLGRELSALAEAAGTPLVPLTHRDADIADPAAVADALVERAPSLVINAAAYNAVDRAESEVDAAMQTNAVGPAVLASACSAMGVPIIHVSTDYVFDGKKAGAYREDDVICPLGVYARSKAAGEAAVRHEAPAHLIVRTAWLYGTHGSNFLKTMVRLAGERDVLQVVSDQHGSPTSTFDLAGGLLRAAAAIEAGATPWGTYHLAGSGETTRHAFASHIVEAQRAFTGRAPRVDPVLSADYPTAAVRPKNSVLDSGKFAATFGFRAADWREAVDDAVAALFAGEAAS